MKHILQVIVVFLFVSCVNQTRGFECFTANELRIIEKCKEVFEVKMAPLLTSKNQNPYEEFIHLLSEDKLDSTFFSFDDALVEEFYNIGIWRVRSPRKKENDSKSENYVKVEPPVGTVIERYRIETITLSENANFIDCLRKRTLDKSLSYYLKMYDDFGRTNASFKADLFKEFWKAKHYKNIDVQTFILVDIYLQKVINQVRGEVVYNIP